MWGDVGRYGELLRLRELAETQVRDRAVGLEVARVHELRISSRLRPALRPALRGLRLLDRVQLSVQRAHLEQPRERCLVLEGRVVPLRLLHVEDHPLP